MTPREIFLRLVQGVADRDFAVLPGLYAEQVDVRHPMAPGGDEPLLTREALREHFGVTGPRVAETVRFQPDNIRIHETQDPEVIVAEFDYAGTVIATGELVPGALCVRPPGPRRPDRRVEGLHRPPRDGAGAGPTRRTARLSGGAEPGVMVRRRSPQKRRERPRSLAAKPDRGRPQCPLEIPPQALTLRAPRGDAFSALAAITRPAAASTMSLNTYCASSVGVPGNRSPKNSTSGDMMPTKRHAQHQQPGAQELPGDQRDPDEALHHRGEQQAPPARRRRPA